MASLIYTALASLDGYIEDDEGSFDFAFPDAEVHAVRERARGDDRARTCTDVACTRRWRSGRTWSTSPGCRRRRSSTAAIWRDLDKVVFSTTLDEVWTPRTELLREFDPVALRARSTQPTRTSASADPVWPSTRSGPAWSTTCTCSCSRSIVGGGKPGLPRDVRLDLELVDERRFDNGVVHLHLRTP